MQKKSNAYSPGHKILTVIGVLAVMTGFGLWSGCQTATATMGVLPGRVPGQEFLASNNTLARNRAASSPTTAMKATTAPPTRSNPAPMIPASFSDVAKQASPAVVNIATTRMVQAQAMPFQGPGGNRAPWGDLFKMFGVEGSRRPRKAHSLGTGFIVNPSGLAITNNHVVEGAEEILVTLSDGREFSAKILGRDPKTDLALIRIEAQENFPYLALGDSDRTDVGDWVVAIGNPFGLDHTVTSGILSARGRVIGAGPYDDFLQTSASINPGNSGGPLLNLSGEVIGINTAIIPGGQGIGFAIPSNLAGKIVGQLEQKGKVVRGWLGVVVQELTPELAKSFGLKNDEGALVADIAPGGPADRAGLERGDVIVSFNGRKIDTSTQLPQIVAETPVGTRADLTVVRQGRSKKLSARIQEMEEEKTARTFPRR